MGIPNGLPSGPDSLGRNNLDEAEELILSSLAKVRERGTKKREGCFLRLFGELQISRGAMDAALKSMNQGIDVLKEVGNVRQLWQAHASLARAFEKLGRPDNSHEHWGAAAQIIENTGNGLADLQLRDDFLNARPINDVLTKAHG